MFHDSNMPDFDSMSQDELIAWLETLEKRQRDAAAESSPDDKADNNQADPQLLPETGWEEWSDWLGGDEAPPQETPPTAENPLQPVQILDEDDDETPTAMTNIGDSGSDDTTDPLTWLVDIATETDSPETAPAHTAHRDEIPDHLADPERAGATEDPLDWLDSLASEVSEAPAELSNDLAAEIITDNFDDAGAGDDPLADSEDESLYSHHIDESLTFPDALIGLDEPVDEAFNTQSVAPLPDFLLQAPDAPASDLEPRRDSPSATSAPPPYDSLTHAFLVQDRQAELEAWYAERLRIVAVPGDTAIPPPTAPPPGPEALKIPPPGLRAGFKTARDKIAAGELEAALADYETLLRAEIGLNLVVSDLQWLITQAQHQDNPAVHRVLGDALMRQGHLQQALEVYRHALKLL